MGALPPPPEGTITQRDEVQKYAVRCDSDLPKHQRALWQTVAV
jgi:hypothetical protein